MNVSVHVAWIGTLRQKVAGRSTPENARAAVARAFAAFDRDHPEWAAALFDEHFLCHRGARVIDAVLSGGVVGARKLAHAWAEQFSWPVAARRRAQVERLIPAAAHFLQLVRAELETLG